MRSCSATRNQLGRSFHSGRRTRHADAGRRDRPLHRGEHRQLFGGRVLREGGGEGLVGQPDQPVASGASFGACGMRLGAIEHIGDRLAFVRRQRGDIDQRLDLVAARRRDHGAGIGMAGQHDRARRPARACGRAPPRRPRTRSAAAAPQRASMPSALQAADDLAQLDPSAQAPWTSTTLTSFEVIRSVLPAREHVGSRSVTCLMML